MKHPSSFEHNYLLLRRLPLTTVKEIILGLRISQHYQEMLVFDGSSQKKQNPRFYDEAKSGLLLDANRQFLESKNISNANQLLCRRRRKTQPWSYQKYTINAPLRFAGNTAPQYSLLVNVLLIIQFWGLWFIIIIIGFQSFCFRT